MAENEEKVVVSVDMAMAKKRSEAIIEAVELKVKTSGSSLRAVLAKAGVEYSTFWRWKQNPPETLIALVAVEMAAEELAAARLEKP